MISAKDVVCEIGDFRLNMSVDVGAREYFVLFGMTGCGKTSFLESLCGLRQILSGKVFVESDDITQAHPRDRRFGYVPQDGALFHHLKVKDNIGFALTIQGVPKDQRERTVREMADRLGIAPLLERRIAGLSGGERQRVALARALTGSPRALLLDEPVSALDEFTRDVVCRELTALQREEGLPVIHVCHSFEEATLVADRVGIMRAGSIVQTGKPDEIIQSPRDAYVARIVRMDNIFSDTDATADGKSTIRIGDVSIRSEKAPSGKVDFLIRSWRVLVAEEEEEYDNIIRGTVSSVVPTGVGVKIHVKGPLPLVAAITRQEAENFSLSPGRAVRLGFPRDAVHILERDSR